MPEEQDIAANTSLLTPLNQFVIPFLDVIVLFILNNVILVFIFLTILCIVSIWKAYWNWCWDDMVTYDLPAIFNYVSSQTGQKINYVGHSLVSI